MHGQQNIKKKVLSVYSSADKSLVFPMVSLEFFIDIILPIALWPCGDSASNRNEYQEYFLWGKDDRCVGLATLPPSYADCLEIWEPQTSGTLRACQVLYTPSNKIPSA